MKKLSLTIDLIPKTSFMDNVRKAVSADSWDMIRRKTYAEYKYACGACAIENVVLECHEIWKFNEKQRIQKLTGLIALCSKCHRVKHFGFAIIQAQEGKLNLEDLIAHFLTVNNCEPEDFKSHLNASIEIWEKRSKKEWKIDLGEYSKYATRAEPWMVHTPDCVETNELIYMDRTKRLGKIVVSDAFKLQSSPN
jgi:hypothetical protein